MTPSAWTRSDTISGIEDTSRRSRAAAGRIEPHVRKTPLVRSAAFSDIAGADVWFKLENRQYTGSFKIRGATNRLLTLTAEERSRGCVAASSGNHGAAVAYAMRALDTAGIVFVPEQTSSAKVDAIRRYGGDVRYFGTDGLDTERHARKFASENGMFYVSPYNDEQVIAGQGTCGVEILGQLPGVDTLFVAVGGGGLASGVGSVLKSHDPATRIYGCQPLASPVMARSMEAGHVVDMPSAATLSDGTAGGIEPESLTFPVCQAVIDEFVLVDEAQIADAMRRYMASEGDTIEGAAGVAIAALLELRELLRGRTVVVIICGGNISDEKLQEVIAEGA